MRALYTLEWRDDNGGWLLHQAYTSLAAARAVAKGWHSAGPSLGFKTRIRKWVRP